MWVAFQGAQQPSPPLPSEAQPHRRRAGWEGRTALAPCLSKLSSFLMQQPRSGLWDRPAGWRIPESPLPPLQGGKREASPWGRGPWPGEVQDRKRMLNPSHSTPVTLQPAGDGDVCTLQAWKQVPRGQGLGHSHSQAAPTPGLAFLLLMLTSASFQGPEPLPRAAEPSWQTRSEVKMKGDQVGRRGTGHRAWQISGRHHTIHPVPVPPLDKPQPLLQETLESGGTPCPRLGRRGLMGIRWG